MSTEENKALVRRIFAEGINQNHPSVLDEVLAPDFVIYDPPLGMQPNREGFRQMFTGFRTAFPDIHVTIEAELAAADYVIHRGYTTATHQGEFQGIAPTGKQVKIKSLDIRRVANGKAVENWV